MIVPLSLLFRSVTLVILFVWWLYWNMTKRTAEQEKPPTKSEGEIFKKQQIRRVVLKIAELLMVVQVIGINILPLPLPQFIVQCIGFIFVLIGASVALSARKTLGANWANAHEYQVKKKQELVTIGVYSLIRHPIYSGLCLVFIGGELVAQSYLVVIGFVLLSLGYWQARQEEAILLKHFGKQYLNYMKHTKMFIPFLW
jgi:protein-S-isoprenylcysteine O-methyltransferase Ste14